MSIFNLNWFKTKKKQEELLDLQIRKEKLITDSIEKQLSVSQPSSKLYKKVKFVNDILTVVFNDGSVLNKSQATVDDFSNVRNSITEDEIINIIRGSEEKKHVLDEIASPTYDDIQIVRDFPDFEMAEECIYMNGIQRSLPPLLVKRFGEILSKFDRTVDGWETLALEDIEYSSLKKFWLKCCLNPNAQSAEDLYTFLTHHNMKIDRHGNFFAYRRVVSVRGDGDTGLPHFISTAYNNVKAVWKKNPANYRVEEKNGEYSFHKVISQPKGKIVGNLDTLYKDLPNMGENRYTDDHTHTMDYRVGEIASIPRDQCDDNNGVNCSKGSCGPLTA